MNRSSCAAYCGNYTAVIPEKSIILKIHKLRTKPVRPARAIRSPNPVATNEQRSSLCRANAPQSRMALGEQSPQGISLCRTEPQVRVPAPALGMFKRSREAA
jgi:hypothetical protein